MSYKPYVRKEEYTEIYNGSVIPDGELERALRQACRHIDSLTFNRIVAAGFCMQADFEYENADEINTILSSYSINGVSAQFGSSWNVFMEKGIAMKRDVYSLLTQTGLCCRIAR